MALHDQFLRAFLQHAHSRERRVQDAGAAAWSSHAMDVLHAVQRGLKFYCACSTPVRVRHFGERREWLWDMSWYSTEGSRYDLPNVVIEHENSHDDRHFMDDFWKVAAAHAPLRVMIGYTGRNERLLERRINVISESARAWTFPQQSTDVVVLRRYAHPTWDILVRNQGDREFARFAESPWTE